MRSRPPRILFLDGPGDLIGSFRRWRAGEQYPGETAATYSGQFFEVATRLRARVHAIAWPGDRERVEDGEFVIEHRPRVWSAARGAAFHAAQALWASDLMAVALRFRPDVVMLVDTPPPFLFAPLGAGGTRVVVALHNTLWPAHHPPSGLARLMARANGWFFRNVADATLALSPECERQVRSMAGSLRGSIEQYRPRFTGRIADAPGDDPGRPFRVLFASRAERNKGVFDVVELAARLEASRPGGFLWTICGGGSAEGQLAAAIRERGLSRVVQQYGQVQRTRLLELYAACDAVIVPTTSAFAEGMAKVALEAVLAGRPAIVSDTVPAGEILGDAALIAPAGDLAAFTRAVERLADDAAFYRATCDAAVRCSTALLDPSVSFEAVVERTLRRLLPLAPEFTTTPPAAP